MHQRDQLLEALLLNDQFVRWVLDPTPARDQYWQQWQGSDPDRKAIVSEARRLVHQMRAAGQVTPLHEQEVQHMWQTLQKRHSEAHRKSGRQWPLRWYGLAASIGLFLAFGIFLLTRTNEPALITHQTSYGETRYITLPDRSSVLLNANSSITYSEDWRSSPKREVTLTGEAFFDVYHSEDHRPFLVHARAVTVEVVGTSFNVLNRRDRTQVVLQEGEVRLRAETASALPGNITMKPGELVEIKDDHYTQQPVDIAPYTAWTQDEHIFVGTTLADIAQLLEDTYGLEVRVANKSLLEKKFTGRIARGDLNSLFGQLEKVFQLTVEQNQQRVTIR